MKPAPDIFESVSRNSVLLLSGGIDSILTLHFARAFFDLPCICCAQDFTKDQWAGIEWLISDWDLTVYVYPPMNRYFVPNGSDAVSLIDEYRFGDAILPVIRDFDHSDAHCALELSSERTGGFWLGWDTVLTGLRSEDSHAVFGKLSGASSFGRRVKFISPLFEWTKQEVHDAAERLDLLKYVASPDTGNVQACTNCLTGQGNVFCPRENKDKKVLAWDKKAMRQAFQDKYGAISI